jgi:hypothetical protein
MRIFHLSVVSFHPFTFPIVVLIELGGLATNGGIESLLAICAVNLALLYLLGEESVRRDFVRLLRWTAIWGIGFYTLIQCREMWVPAIKNCAVEGGASCTTMLTVIIEHCPLVVASALLPILFVVGAIALVSSTFNSDRASALLLSRGIPFSVVTIFFRCKLIMVELRTAGSQAFMLHRLSGRVANSWTSKFMLLADVVSSSFYRSLCGAYEAQFAVRSRLTQRHKRPAIMVRNRIGPADITVISIGLLTVASLHLIQHLDKWRSILFMSHIDGH